MTYEIRLSSTSTGIQDSKSDVKISCISYFRVSCALGTVQLIWFKQDESLFLEMSMNQ